MRVALWKGREDKVEAVREQKRLQLLVVRSDTVAVVVVAVGCSYFEVTIFKMSEL